jgi:PmbA protein
LGLGIRVINKESIGFSYTNDMDFSGMEKCLKEAFSLAKNSPITKGVRFAPKTNIKQIKETYNKDLANLPITNLIDDAKTFIKGFTSIDKRINAILGAITLRTRGTAIMNSNGLEVEQKQTDYQGEFLLVAHDQGKAGAYVSDDQFSRKQDIDFLSLGKKLGKKAIDNLNQTTLSKFDGPIIFGEKAMVSPILMVMSLAVSADSRQRGSSFWKDKLAAQVTDERINLKDQPHDLSGGTGTIVFDDEGTATQELDIITDGILQQFLHNQRTANKEDLESTGNATRKFGAGATFATEPQYILPNSPTLLPGEITEEEMIEDTRKGLIFDNYQGTIRYQNGIFSGVIKGAYLIENGEITKPVTGISIAGNVFEIINNLRSLGKELHLVSGYARTPKAMFDGIRVSTK